MNKKFSGFTQQQMEAIAKSMGCGSVEEFNSFLASSPDKAAKLSRLTEKARKFVETPPQKMADGGVVKDVNGNSYTLNTETGLYEPTSLQKNNSTKTGGDTKKEEETTKTTTTTSPLSSSQELIKNPEKYTTNVEVDKINKDEARPGIIDKDSGQAGKAEQVTNISTGGQAATATHVPKTEANTVTADMAASDVNQVADQTQAAQGTVSEQSQVQAATALPSADATVAGQMEKLMAQFQDGNTPAWAAGAMRKAQTAMASRGLGSSSMAGAAITQAAMESTIAIAAQDAATFSQFEMQNLNNRQQARLQNAQAFLQMDMQNLSNEQQVSLFKSQARIQALFTDQAAENAARQFNATSQNQTDQFFANLRTQVSTFNASQKNAMKMFNSEQKNAVKMFNVEQRNAREQFNAQNRLVVDQSNAEWRRQIATTNNANENEANRINAQNATQLTLAGYNNLWQVERDLMAYAFTAAENASQRAHEVVLAKMGADVAKDKVKAENDFAWGAAAGKVISSIVDDIDWGGIF